LLENDGGIETVFADVAEIAQACRFNDCLHESEPGCAVQAALYSRTLDAHRLQSYRKLQREIAATERRRDPILAANERRRWKTIHKELRAREKAKSRY
jgi:ribosome biogenesis GTPase